LKQVGKEIKRFAMGCLFESIEVDSHAARTDGIENGKG